MNCAAKPGSAAAARSAQLDSAVTYFADWEQQSVLLALKHESVTRILVVINI